MRNMHFKYNIKNYLYDLDDFITIYDGHLHAFNYNKLVKLSEKEIIIIFSKYRINIIGNDLKVKIMTKDEMLINGNILKVEFLYERE